MILSFYLYDTFEASFCINSIFNIEQITYMGNVYLILQNKNNVSLKEISNYEDINSVIDIVL